MIRFNWTIFTVPVYIYIFLQKQNQIAEEVSENSVSRCDHLYERQRF